MQAKVPIFLHDFNLAHTVTRGRFSGSAGPG